MHSTHHKLYKIIAEAVQHPERIDKRFYIGTTYLIAKVQNACLPQQLRPITCLPNLYKVVSKVVTDMLTNTCEINEILSPSQMGTRRACQGAKELALLNKNINIKYNNRLFTSWIDIQKAFDSVRHEYLIDCLQKLKIDDNVIHFVKRVLENQRTNLLCNGEEIGSVTLEKGIIQGDALSPLLFVITMEPLSRILDRYCEKLPMTDNVNSLIKRNHLIFIDDVKLLAKDQQGLEELCRHTSTTLHRMGFTINQQKSASNIDSPTTFGEVVCDRQGYKYLGILENSCNIIKEDNKLILQKRATSRIKSLCETHLNARNLFAAINEFALSTFNYYIGIIPFEPEEMREMDMQVRRILYDHKISRHASNVDRLYLSRTELGRGLQNLEEKAEHMLLKLHHNLDGNYQSKEIIDIEKQSATQLGLIAPFLRSKYGFKDNQITSKQLKAKQLEYRMERINHKELHSVLFRPDPDNPIDTAQSTLWLKSGNISPKLEAIMCKVQDRNVFFDGGHCNHCSAGNVRNKKKKTVDHLATQCGRLLSFDYKKRHDAVVRCLHFLFSQRYGLTKFHRLKNYKVEGVVSNDRVKIKADVPIHTELHVQENKPDLMVHDLVRKEIMLVEVGITSKHNLASVETTKSRKYETLANELQLIYPQTKVTTVPVVLTWDGLVSPHYKRHMKTIGVPKRVQAYIQSMVIKRTTESIMIDRRLNPMAEVDIEEMFDLDANQPIE
jgi:hypothetical protein